MPLLLPPQQVFVDGASWTRIRSAADVMSVMAAGNSTRTTGQHRCGAGVQRTVATTIVVPRRPFAHCHGSLLHAQCQRGLQQVARHRDCEHGAEGQAGKAERGQWVV